MLPLSYEAEYAFLGAVLLANRAIDRPREFLLPSHFAEPLHGRIYQACLDLLAAGKILNAITLKVALGEDPDLDRLGGNAFLARLVGGAATVINALDYARLIYSTYMRREIIWVGEQMIAEAFNPEGVDEELIVEKIGAQIAALNQQLALATGKKKPGLKPPRVYVGEALELARVAQMRLPGDVPGIATGLSEFDRRVGGLMPGDMMILGGRPSMGKSSLGITIAHNVAKRLQSGGTRQHVLFFSPEMSGAQIGARLLGFGAHVSQMSQRTGPISSDQMRDLEEEADRLAEINLWVDDAPIRFVDQLSQRARDYARNAPVGLIVVDYLQLIGGIQNRAVRQENRATELAGISTALKGLAKELDAALIGLSQLSRAVEQREDKRPILSDLRDSGGLEQDADLVGFLYREWYYLSQSAPKQGAHEKMEDFANRETVYLADIKRTRYIAEVNFAKTRHGPTGVVTLAFDPVLQHFTNLVRLDDDPSVYSEDIER